MFERVVLGIDPGTASVGLAVVVLRSGTLETRWSANVRTPAGLATASRLRQIHDHVAAAIAEHRPDAVAVERLMWGRNTRSAMDVARASGVILLAAAEAGLEVEEYAPLEVKMSVTGQGNAPKDQVRRALAALVGAAGVPTQADAADAVAVAVCHLGQSRLRALTRAAAR
jgi:crossover junction endodeoxyribonuclease RuvC